MPRLVEPCLWTQWHQTGCLWPVLKSIMWCNVISTHDTKLPFTMHEFLSPTANPGWGTRSVKPGLASTTAKLYKTISSQMVLRKIIKSYSYTIAWKLESTIVPQYFNVNVKYGDLRECLKKCYSIVNTAHWPALSFQHAHTAELIQPSIVQSKLNKLVACWKSKQGDSSSTGSSQMSIKSCLHSNWLPTLTLHPTWCT